MWWDKNIGLSSKKELEDWSLKMELRLWHTGKTSGGKKKKDKKIISLLCTSSCSYNMSAGCGWPASEITVLPGWWCSEGQWMRKSQQVERKEILSLMEKRDASLTEVKLKRNFWPIMRLNAWADVQGNAWKLNQGPPRGGIKNCYKLGN